MAMRGGGRSGTSRVAGGGGGGGGIRGPRAGPPGAAASRAAGVAPNYLGLRGGGGGNLARGQAAASRATARPSKNSPGMKAFTSSRKLYGKGAARITPTMKSIRRQQQKRAKRG